MIFMQKHRMKLYIKQVLSICCSTSYFTYVSMFSSLLKLLWVENFITAKYYTPSAYFGKTLVYFCGLCPLPKLALDDIP